MNKKNKKNKKKKNIFNVFSKIVIVLTVIGIIVWGFIYAANYAIGEEDADETGNGQQTITANKKEIINALLCGISENLTDTMIYVRYEVATGKLAFMSIPRDTYVTNSYCIGHKINAIYRGTNIEPLVNQIEEMLDVSIDYYLVVNNSLVREVVDVIGGVEINVPFRMKYDDPTQNLHINLQPGIQVLDGAKAEQFIRFRHNNDMTVGYASGDIGRTEAQQNFIKAFIKELIDPTTIVKLPELINIVLKNTETNVTVREALRYVTDASKLQLDSIYSCTAPGTTPYIDNISYFKMDEEEAQRIIKEEFIGANTSTSEATDETTN